MYFKTLLTVFLLILALLGGNSFARTGGSDPADMIKKFLIDRKFTDENYYHKEIRKEKTLDYKTGELKKEETLQYEYLPFNGKMRRREYPRSQKSSGNAYGFEPVDNSSLDFDPSLLNRFNFQEMETLKDGKRSFHRVTFTAVTDESVKTKATIKGYDIKDVLNKLAGDIEVWDDGTLKSARVFLLKEAKVEIWGPFAGGKIKVLKAELTTQLVEGRVVPLSMDVEYKFTPTGVGGGLAKIFAKDSVQQHKMLTIMYSDYKYMTPLEKTDYLNSGQK